MQALSALRARPASETRNRALSGLIHRDLSVFGLREFRVGGAGKDKDLSRWGFQYSHRCCFRHRVNDSSNESFNGLGSRYELNFKLPYRDNGL